MRSTKLKMSLGKEYNSTSEVPPTTKKMELRDKLGVGVLVRIHFICSFSPQLATMASPGVRPKPGDPSWPPMCDEGLIFGPSSADSPRLLARR